MGTRRRFIRDCSALAAAAACLPVGAMPAPRGEREVLPGEVSFGTFAAQVNTSFHLRDADGYARTLVLIEAEPAADGGDGVGEEGGGESFSLFFRGEVNRPLGQDTYAFEHARIGRFPMFIVPVGREDRNHCYYEAIFNRPSPELLLPEQPLVRRPFRSSHRSFHG